MPATPTGALQILFTTAAFAPAYDRTLLQITGPDATRWLNGMVTNSVQALQPGEGNYNFLLNAQGRIQGDCTIYRDPEDPQPAYLLETDTAQIEAIHRTLDKFIIMDDVELASVENGEETLLLLGPQAPALLTTLGLPVLGPLHLARTGSTYGPLLITTPREASVPVFTLHGSPDVVQELHRALTQAGVPLPDHSTLESFRVLQATPRFGTDVRDRDLPQETAQPDALHFAKGCYLGQEIVERIRSRGQVHRQFTPFRLEGAPPPEAFPVPLEANGKPAGELTSAIVIPSTEGPRWIALGYARREFLDTQTELTYPGGTAHPRQPGHLT